jgi:hypothetical protein
LFQIKVVTIWTLIGTTSLWADDKGIASNFLLIKKTAVISEFFSTPLLFYLQIGFSGKLSSMDPSVHSAGSHLTTKFHQLGPDNKGNGPIADWWLTCTCSIWNVQALGRGCAISAHQRPHLHSTCPNIYFFLVEKHNQEFGPDSHW